MRMRLNKKCCAYYDSHKVLLKKRALNIYLLRYFSLQNFNQFNKNIVFFQMENFETNEISNQFIEKLCGNQFFIRKIRSILQTEDSSLDNQQIFTLHDDLTQSNITNNNPQIEDQPSELQLPTILPHSKKKTSQRTNNIQINKLVQQINETLIKAVLKETNQVYSSYFKMIGQIETIKENIEKITEGKKSCSQSKQKTGANTSIFFDPAEQSQIQTNNQRHRSENNQDKNLSFINSFIRDDDTQFNINSNQYINQTINASISKVESSIQDKICTLQKEFTRRIQQIMKTIKHLISMISEEYHQKKKINKDKQIEKDEQSKKSQNERISNNIKTKKKQLQKYNNEELRKKQLKSQNTKNQSKFSFFGFSRKK